VGPGGGRLAKSPGRPVRLYIGLACGFVHTRQNKGKAKAVEKISGGQTTCLVNNVARPVGHHMVSFQLNHVGNPSLDPYKHPSTGGNQNTHHILEIPLVKLPFLV
jgi:hypothetical protein